MSEQPPPSFGGAPNYNQQWPPAYPAMMPQNFSIPQEYSAVNNQQNHGAPFDYNMSSVDANSRMPASSDGLNPAAFFPPQFPFFNQFDPSQFPPNFSPMHLASMGFPPMPIPPPSSAAPLPQQTTQQQFKSTFVKPPPSKRIPIRAPPSREEGEVSEPVNEKPLKSSRKPSRQYSDLEEGETMSSSGRSSRRSSGSPYNPPLSVSADPSIIQHAVDTQTKPTKSAAQLRIQAQGALLSLAPHQIRYKELAAEGINPVVLKRLYEEVGIKVTLDSDSTVSTREGPSSITQPDKPSPSIKEPQSSSKANIPASQTAVSAAPGSKSSKPMERKELIAQMLAEKAAKVASKEPSPIDRTTSAPVVSEARPPKEKSKAQTELARQRIEELKQKALLKTKQKLQETLSPSSQEAPAPAIHHPLPVRPPVPESHAPAGLPGLLMSSGPSQQAEEAVPDSTPISRTIHRKRPLASDFDEPFTNSKKHFNPAVDRFKPVDKLIIAISDDESLYGDDEDDQMELDSGSEQEATPLVSSANTNPLASGHLSSTRASTSTPQATPSLNDQGHIQSKDLQIQEMRRRIAELELRRKSKLAASQTQSPHTPDDSSASTSAPSSSADVGVSDAGVSMASHDDPTSKPQTLALEPSSAQTNESPSLDTAPASASSESGSEGSVMEESDDSSSESSDSSEDEDDASSSPVPASPVPVDVPAVAEPMDIESSPQSQPEVANVNGDRTDDMSQRESSVESEAYEPPEPESDAQSEGSSYSPPPFSPAPDPVDSIAASMPSLDAAQPTAELTTAPQVSDAPSQVDLQAENLGVENSSADPVPKQSAHKFTPYTSPLRSFKAYRYHPNFSEDIASGYRSLTYSHNIDSMKSLCPYEVSGGVCNDRSCEFQHLRDLSLSDDKILIQMGSAREGQTEEEKETYLAGLKEIINDLRRDKVKDFNTVASEIAAYRRRFLQDPSRVLSL